MVRYDQIYTAKAAAGADADLSSFGALNIAGPSRADHDLDVLVSNAATSNPHKTDSARSPRPSSNVPFRRDEDFVDRGDILARVDERCSRPAGRAALVGFGGFGKSQIAIEYAHCVRRRDPMKWVFWMHASNASRIEGSFRDIAQRIGLPQMNNTAETLRQVRTWLANEANGQWLAIVDNLDEQITVDPRHYRPSLWLSSLLPQSENGAVLITSRNRDVARQLVNPQRDIINVDAMSEDEAVELLAKKLGSDALDDARQLVRELECIPLALAHAASYIDRLHPRMTILRYLTELESCEKRTALLRQEPPNTRQDEQATRSVFATWAMSFEHIRNMQSSAADLLSFMSFFNRQGIPEFMIQHYTEGRANTGEGRCSQPVGNFLDDIALLQAFSLVKFSQHGGAYEMHRLVQQATRTWLVADGTCDRWRKHFTRVLALHFPPPAFDQWPKCRLLYPHVLSMTHDGAFDREEMSCRGSLLYRAAGYVWGQGLYRQAEALCSEARDIQVEVLGNFHPYTLEITSALASIMSALGKDEAMALHRKVLEARRTVLGPEHVETLESMSNLAVALSEHPEHIEEAEIMQRQVLAIFRKASEATHVSDVPKVSDAVLLWSQQAGSLETTNISEEVTILRQSMHSMHSLAVTLTRRGRYKEAEALYREILDQSRGALGEEHPFTLSKKFSLALNLQRQSKFEAAEASHRETLAAQQTILGPNHVDSLRSCWGLASSLGAQGQFAESVALLQTACQGFIVVLGEEHPNTKGCLQELSAARASRPLRPIEESLEEAIETG